MSNKKSNVVDENGRRYRKSNSCDCCNSPTTFQESEDAAGYDDCDLKEGEWAGWMEKHFFSGRELTGSCSSKEEDLDNKSIEVPKDTGTLKVDDSTSPPETSGVPPTVLHVASVDPSLSTSASNQSSASVSSRYYDSPYKKRKFQEFKREQEAIMDAILSESGQKKAGSSSDKFKLAESARQSMMAQHFVPCSKMNKTPVFSPYVNPPKKAT